MGELGEIMTGSTPSTSKSEYYSEEGIPWVTPTDINALTISDTPKKLSEKGMKVGRVVPANTILCTCIASIGKNALLTVKGSFNQQINSLTPSAENDSYFLLTESELWSEKMKRMAASGTMQIVNKTEFSELDTMVPSLDEQKIIGLYFRNLDHLITLHQRKPIPHPNHPTTHTKHKGEEKYVRIRVNDRGKINRTANLRRFPVDIPGRFKDGGGSVGEFQIYSGAE